MYEENSLPPFLEQKEESVKYNLSAPKIEGENKTCKAILLHGFGSALMLQGKTLTDEKFKDLNSDAVITAKSLDESVKLAHVAVFDYKAEPFIKKIIVTPVSEFNQMKQGKQPLAIVTVDRAGKETEREIKGIFNEEKEAFVYNVGEKISFDKYVKYQLLSGISVNIEVVY